MTSEKLKKLEKVLLETEKKYGKGVAFIIGENKEVNDVEKWAVDSPKISYVLGGGNPKGRIIEIYGKESGGKTSTACYLAGQIQKQGGTVAFIDAEHSLDIKYVKTLGFNVEDCIFVQPDHGEQALSIAEELVESGEVDYIIIDSVAALTPLAEINGEMEDKQMGEQARMMSKACRKLVSLIAKKKTSILFINQIREKIGIAYGSPLTTPGGNALKFYSTIRLEINKKEIINDGDTITGIVVRIKAVKNKVAPPMRDCECKIIFGKGFQVEEEWIDFAIENNIIEKSGSWFSTKNGRIQGKDNIIEYFKKNDEEFKEIIEKTKKAMQKIEIDKNEEIVEENKKIKNKKNVDDIQNEIGLLEKE